MRTFSFIGLVFLVAISWANETPAVAALLTNWQFEPTDSQLEIFSLQGTTPRHFLQIKPIHKVVDLPNAQLGRLETQPIDSGSGYQVGVSPFQKGITRIVFERSPQQLSLQKVGPMEARNRWLWHPLIVQMPTTDSPSSSDLLPPANLPLNQGGVVKVPPVNRPEAILPRTGTPMRPPTIFPTNQTPTLTVPTLEDPSTQTPTPLTTSKPLEGSFRRVSPAISPVPVIEFGQPLPKTVMAKPVPKLQQFRESPHPQQADFRSRQAIAKRDEVWMNAFRVGRESGAAEVRSRPNTHAIQNPLLLLNNFTLLGVN